MVELGAPILRKIADPVDDVFSQDTSNLIRGMVDVLTQQKGIGLAAPQVGVKKQVFIVAPEQIMQRPFDDISTGLVVINPTIEFNTKTVTYEWEGCLSIPGIRGKVPRQCDITIQYTNIHGELRKERYSGFTARIFCHEFDHLNGVLFLDRLEDIKTQLVTDRFYATMVEEDYK